ncbi:hypothetical protein ACFYO9_37645 [Streptomyces sp. NPDC005863]|uniref:hypothetical protein n=1 Tax=Streptomyces sp. NPDC005863 TaxID=3364735 RepID=UPI00367BCEFD
MTFTIPGLRAKPLKSGNPRHRVDDYIRALKDGHEKQLAELRDENVALLNAKGAADDGAAIQEQLIADLEADVRKLKEQAHIDHKHLAQQAGIIRTLREDLDEARGRRTDRTKVETATTETQPIPVLPLHQSPLAAVTDPGRVRQTTWGREREREGAT